MLRTELKRSIETQDAKIAKIEHKMLMKNNDLDQHFRLHNSIFHNMQGTGEGSKDIANQLNYMLPRLSTPVSIHNIDIVHPLKGDRTHFIVMVYWTEPLNEQAGEGFMQMEACSMKLQHSNLKNS